MIQRIRLLLAATVAAAVAVAPALATPPVAAGASRPAGPHPVRRSAADFHALEDSTAAVPGANEIQSTTPPSVIHPAVLLAGDSWAQYMWDDGSHNDIFDKFGFEDRRALSLSLGSDPGPGYTGPEYAVSGSEARQWVDTASYPWIANMVGALQSNPTIDLVMLSLGGNDVLAGRPDGGWYKDMDLDVPGSEAAFFNALETSTLQVAGAALAVRPDLQVILSSYDYPNFNVSALWCWVYACPKRRDLSRDPTNALITDQELNQMMVNVEQRRIGWVNATPRMLFDHAVGLMHFWYGDGVSAPLTLPFPGQAPPAFAPFPGGNPLRPTLRSNFRKPNGLDADPIHLNAAGYQYKITSQTGTHYFPHFRGNQAATFVSQGGANDGWTNGVTTGTTGIRLGDTGPALTAGLVSFDTSALPDGATVTSAALYLIRDSLTGTNPFTSSALGTPQVDVARGSFGGAAVEPGDDIEPATAGNAGYLVGSAKSNGYAVRVEITGAGLAAINDQGLTQFRLRFPTLNSGGTADYVVFRDGDAAPPAPSASLPTLAEYMGSSKPFLDVQYLEPSGVPDAAPRPPAARFFPASPNPFRMSTSIRFSLAEAGPARLDIFDLSGRRIRTLVDGTRPAGHQTVTWDGYLESGAPAPAGLYFARLSAGGAVVTGRVARVDR